MGVAPASQFTTTETGGPVGVKRQASFVAIQLPESLPGATRDGGLIPPPFIPITPLPSFQGLTP